MIGTISVVEEKSPKCIFKILQKEKRFNRNVKKLFDWLEKNKYWNGFAYWLNCRFENTPQDMEEYTSFVEDEAITILNYLKDIPNM